MVRVAGLQAAGRGRRRRVRRRRAAPRRAARGDLERGPELVARQYRAWTTEHRPRARAGRHPDRALPELGADRAAPGSPTCSRPSLPGPHPAGDRPGAPVPAPAQQVAQPRGPALARRPPAAQEPASRVIQVPPILERFVHRCSPTGLRRDLRCCWRTLIARHVERAVPRHARSCGRVHLPRHPQLRTSRSTTTRPRTCCATDPGRAAPRANVAPPVRLEIGTGERTRDGRPLLGRALELDRRSDVYRVPGPLELADLWRAASARPSGPRGPAVRASAPAAALRADLHDDGGDLRGHPRARTFCSTTRTSRSTGSVQAFIEQAADDPQVLAIKQTLYRTTGDSPIVNALVARRRDRQAGRRAGRAQGPLRRGEQHRLGADARAAPASTSSTALLGLKTHAKLVPRRAPRGRGDPPLRPPRHRATTTPPPPASTRTSALLHGRPELAARSRELFNLLTGYAHRAGAERLMVAPFDLRQRLAGADRRARPMSHAPATRRGSSSRCNALVDPALIEALYAASEAGRRGRR